MQRLPKVVGMVRCEVGNILDRTTARRFGLQLLAKQSAPHGRALPMRRAQRCTAFAEPVGVAAGDESFDIGVIATGS